MKKYLKLTAHEAIGHFIARYSRPVVESPSEMKKKLADAGNLKGDTSVTIVIPTHRTKPDYESDPIVLKTQIEKVEKELHGMLPKREAAAIIDNIREAQEQIDHSHNQNSLVLYANENFSAAVKVPVDLEKEALVGEFFDFRPLYKTMQQSERYYILTISKNVIRMFEAQNERIVSEIENDDFPFDKNSFYTVKWNRPAADGFADSMEKEFYNDADKSFRKIYLENPLPVILAGDVKSVAYYEEQMDDRRMVIERVKGSYDTAPLHEIAASVSPALEKYRKELQEQELAVIDRAASAKTLVTDINEILENSRDAMTATLFVGNNFTLRPSSLNARNLSEEERGIRRSINDMYFSLLKNVSDNNGDVVFMEDSLLVPYDGIVAIKR